MIAEDPLNFIPTPAMADTILFSRFRCLFPCLLAVTLILTPAPGQGMLRTLDVLAYGIIAGPQVRGSTAIAEDGLAGPQGQSSAYPAGEAGAESKHRKKGGGAEEREFSTFWIIGILINLLVFALFVVWGVREWRKTKHKGPL